MPAGDSVSEAEPANSADHITRLASPLNLTSALQVQLSYMLKYATENGQDRLQVEISTTGVNGIYTPIVTDHTIKESKGSLGNVPAITGSTDGWVRELIDLTPYAGNNNIGLRFRFLSNATNGVAYATDGFQIDNLKVVKTNAVILPVRFEDIICSRVGESVLIKWKAVTDASFHHYNIQRSVDGIAFETIAKLTNANISGYTDNNPNKGRNYYRIQVIENDNTSRFSKTVWIVFAERTMVNAYPNPVTDALNIEILSEKVYNGVVELTTIAGKLVYKSKLILKEGINLHKIDMAPFANHLYVVKIKDDKGAILKTMKVVKNAR